MNAHSSVERAGMLAGIKMRAVESDELYRMQGDQLKLAVEEDRKNGLIPFHVKIQNVI